MLRYGMRLCVGPKVQYVNLVDPLLPWLPARQFEQKTWPENPLFGKRQFDMPPALLLALLHAYSISERFLEFVCCFVFLNNGDRELSLPPAIFHWTTLDHRQSFFPRFR